ncbi:hypothetical protein SEUCBS139899_003010 [Sporothrix eucalyptigena]
MAESARTRTRTSAVVNSANNVISTPAAASTTARSTMSDAEYFVSLSFEELGNGHGNGHGQRLNDVSSLDSPPAASVEPLLSAAPQPSAPLSAHGLPSYIRDLPSHLSAADIDNLTRNGALTLPEDDLQHELFRKYILYAFAFMPVINMESFFAPICRRDGTGKVSLLVYQALLFASAAYVDPEYSAERGYQGRKSLRRTFFKRARLLYDLQCESDPLAVLQALLLMTCWYEKSQEDEEEMWHLVGAALSLAKSLGMHHNPDHLDIGVEQQRLRKKIWWSCFVRDRLLSLGMGRPARIHPGDFDVPMLTMEECELTPLEDDILTWVGPLPIADDCPTKANIYLCFVELVQLCVYMGDVLLQKSSILSNPANVMAGIVQMMVMPRRPAIQVYEGTTTTAQAMDRSLQGWQQSLTPGCRYTKGRGMYEAKRYRNESHQLLRLYQALLHMVYLTATTVLHQSQMLQAEEGSLVKSTRGVALTSRDKVTNAAADITDIVSELNDDDQLRFAPTVAIPALMSATLTHLMDLRAASSNVVRYTSIGRFFQCWQALHCLREMYVSADHAVSFLETVITKTGIRIPMLTMMPMLKSLGPLPGAPENNQIPVDPPGEVIDVDSRESDMMDQSVDIMHNFEASGPQHMAPYTTSMAEPGMYSYHGLEDIHEVVETAPIADPHSEAWNGIEIGEDLFQTLAVFNTHTAFSIGF